MFKSFIGRSKKTSTPAPLQVSLVCTEDKLSTLERKRAILKWRDLQELRIESVLRQHLPSLKQAVWERISSLSAPKFFFRQSHWLQDIADQIIEPWVKVQSVDILRSASSEGIAVVSELGGIHQSEHALNGDESLKQATDLATSLGPIAAGFIAIPTAVSSSMVSAGGLLGFFGILTVAWPVAIFSVTLIGLAFILGGLRVRGLRERANRRAYVKICAKLDVMIMQGGKHQLCLREALQQVIRATAQEQLGDHS